MGITVRHETRSTERRAPVVPADAARLVAAGVAVTVERSPRRAFPVADYVAAGCAVAEAGSWVDAPDDEYVLGLKELPDEPPGLRHRHIFFGHAYKAQPGARELLRRFTTGGGALLDLEYLVDDDGRRLAAFGYWAGYVGAALAILHHRSALPVPLRPMSKEDLDSLLSVPVAGKPPRALVVGALGRSGRGAVAALEAAHVPTTRWDIEETRALDLPALLNHDILVNTVLVTHPVPPFLTPAAVRDNAHRLSIVADVTCDVGSAHNVLPIYDGLGSWSDPVLTAHGLAVIAIDNLPSLLPAEASTSFSAELTPHLARLDDPGGPWQRCIDTFRRHAGVTHV